MSAQHTGLILAGGRSRRFGTPKALHLLKGRPMVAHVYDAVVEVATPVLVSVGKADAHLPLPASVRYVVDAVADAGPLAGLHAGLLATETPWLLAVACDLPAISPAALRLLVAACDDPCAAVVAQSADGRVHPLCACYHRNVLPTAAAQLRAGHLAMHDLLEQLPTRYVSLPDATLCNVNRLSDLGKLSHRP